MESRRKVDKNLRKRVVIMNKERMAIYATARDINSSKSVVSKILKLYEEITSFASLKKRVRSRKISVLQDYEIQRLLLRHSFDIAAAVSHQVYRDYGMNVSQKIDSSLE
ncbi:interleukin-1 receptor type 1-like [Octopus vulgaris]|uniref:Interleukin-1 receptor type 1-like n=1 Tax=Octopus vulgaris TaxID=6645 RepID=A0AA36BD76_OCTVU|nr:interleukin-1 receptor type 1-like [Octopus vulgaris]